MLAHKLISQQSSWIWLNFNIIAPPNTLVDILQKTHANERQPVWFYIERNHVYDKQHIRTNKKAQVAQDGWVEKKVKKCKDRQSFVQLLKMVCYVKEAEKKVSRCHVQWMRAKKTQKRNNWWNSQSIIWATQLCRQLTHHLQKRITWDAMRWKSFGELLTGWRPLLCTQIAMILIT